MANQKREWEHRFIVPPLHAGVPITHQTGDGQEETLRRKDVKELILQLLSDGFAMMPHVKEEKISGQSFKFVDIYCYKFDPEEILASHGE